MINWEAKCHELLSDCSIVDIIAIQVASFEVNIGQPQLILLSSKLKSALIREVYQSSGREPADLIIEPVWINQYPMFFRDLGEHYIKVQNNSIRKELVL